MIVLSFGYKKPQSGDRGSIWFPAIEFDIERLNTHSHDGLNSAVLSTGSSFSVSQNLPTVWTSDGLAQYKQSVTIPSPIKYDTCVIQFRKTDDKSILHLTAVRTSINTFDVYTYDSTLDVTVVYGS
jgi:hypothetical protein